MKKILLSLALALPCIAFAQSGPGGAGIPAIWLKADVGVLPTTNNNPVTSWTNQGTINFTLTPGSAVPNVNINNDRRYVSFASNQSMIYNQTGTELSAILGNGTLDLRYDVFIVATGGTSGALLYMGNATPETNSGAMNHIGFGKRAIYYNSKPQTDAADGDGEIGYYNSGSNLKNRYAPNIADGTIPGDLTVSNITSNPTLAWNDLNSVVFSINGLANIKDPNGDGTNGQTVNYQGKLQTYAFGATNNRYNNLNVSQIILGGVPKWDNSGLRRTFSGNYYEIIVYPTKLTLEQRQKVISYLATKYNIYLVHDTGVYSGTASPGTSVGNGESVTNGTYFASDGSIIFKRDNYSYTNDKDYQDNNETGFIKDTYYPLNASATNNNFQFFGRDDVSGLSTWTTGAPSSVYFEKSPKSALTRDKSFATLTSNAKDLNSYSTTNDVNTPFPVGANIEGRSARTWKITATGYNDNLVFTASANGLYTAGFDNTNSVFLISRTPTFEFSKTASFSATASGSPWIGFNKQLSSLTGSISPGEYKEFYITLAKTNGSPTNLLTTLPVSISAISAKTKGNTIAVNWSTASEKDASHFIITRSTDAQNFVEIGRVDAAGNSNSLKSYSFIDKHPFAGVNYYQLQQVDNDGKINESGIVSAKIALSSGKLVVEKVESNSVTLALTGISTSTGTITATNALGQTIANQAVNFSNGNSFTVNTGAAKGLIIFTLSTAQGTLTKKIAK